MVPFGAGARRLPTYVVVAAAAYLIALALWPLAWDGAKLPDPPWTAMMPGLPALAVATVARPGWAVGYTLIATLCAQTCTTSSASIARPFLLEYLYGFVFCLTFVAAMAMAVRSGQVLDRTRAQAEADAAAAASMEARDRVRRAHAGLLHDWVMTTLLTAARQPDDGGLQRQAQVTLTKLDRVGDGTRTDPYRDVEAVRYLRGAAHDDAAGVIVEATINADTSYPADTVHTLAAGVAEAVRNSRRHAGPTATCMVSIDAEGGRPAVVISDDGIGFEPAAVPSDRYGLVDSVRRIEEVPGGSVAIDSTPTTGTTVRLVWSEPTTGHDRP